MSTITLTTYEWDEKAFRTFKTPPEVFGEITHKIKEEKGICHPEDIVDAARPENSPLHDDFEWDDFQAAEQWRVQQARYMSRSLKIKVVDESGVEREPIRALFSVRDPIHGQGYMPIEAVFTSEENRSYVVNKALQELEAWKARYAQYAEFASIFSAIESLATEAV